jgi:hypothetical protein
VYGSSKLATSVLEYDGVQGTSFKWARRTKHVTCDDGMLVGAMMGLLATARYPALRTLSHPNRFFARVGAGCIGSAVGIMSCIAWQLYRLGERAFDEDFYGEVHNPLPRECLRI